MDFSLDNMLAAGGVFLTSVGSAVGLAKSQVRVIVKEEIVLHEEREAEMHVPIINAMASFEVRMDQVSRDVAYIRGYLDREKTDGRT